jgi:hypothetical protein
LGLRIARWARKIRPSSISLSIMTSPKGSLVCPDELCRPDAVTRRKNTRHDHGPSPWDSRHSIGHLHEAASACATMVGATERILTSCTHPRVLSRGGYRRRLELEMISQNFASLSQQYVEGRCRCRAFLVFSRMGTLTTVGGCLLDVVQVVDEAQPLSTTVCISTSHYHVTVDLSGSRRALRRVYQWQDHL